MRNILKAAAAVAALLLSPSAADSNETLQSKHILPSTFTPPNVFENVNLVRTINLERSYPKETINVAIRNISPEPQQYYYLPFEGEVIGRIGGVEVRDRRRDDASPFVVEQVEYDTYSPTQFYRITLPQPLPPKSELTLAITFHTISALKPLPAKIGQMDKQYLSYAFSAYSPSSYTTLKQKTKIRFPTEDVPDYTSLSSPSTSGIKSENSQDPVKEGASYTYGPFSNVPAGAVEPLTVRYEFTKPLLHATTLERDIEVSHWGGNLATEERYSLINNAAGLSGQFSRVLWQQAAYYDPPTVAMKALWMPLFPDAVDPYYIDDIGNVSTSRFQQGDGKGKAAVLDLRPRYPLFGGWRYKFKVGWDRPLSGSLRTLRTGEGGYVLKVPFLEGPKEREGVEYEKVTFRVVLPEGATDVKFQTLTPLVSSSIDTHRTFMDTTGRTALTLTAVNLVDEMRRWDVVITYNYNTSSALKKPLTIVVATFSVFVVAWLVGSVDVRIGKVKKM